MHGDVLQVEGIIGPTGDLACETQALLAAESAPVSSDFPDKVPPLPHANCLVCKSNAVH